MAGSKPGRPSWLRYSGVGFEFVAAVGVFAFLGYWLVDRYLDSWPWGVVIGTGLGLVGATYNLIRESMAAFKPPGDKRSEPPSHGE